MKAALKKISSFVMAAAVFLSLTPVTGQMILADETETEAPAAVTETEPVKETEKKETEKPKATEKDPEETEKPEAPKGTEAAETEAPKETQAAETEAPKETEKAEADTPKETETAETEAPKETEAAETEAPKETEKAETEAPKETGKTEADAPKATEKPETSEKAPDKAPAVTAKKAAKVGTITNVKLSSKGILTWDSVKDAEYYEIYVSDNQVDNGEPITPSKFNLGQAIDNLIKTGDIEKLSPYLIEVKAYDLDDNLLAQYKGKIDYNSNANPPKLASFKNAGVKNGIISFDEVKGAESYSVNINGCCVPISEKTRSLNINAEIDWLIRVGYIEKDKTYRLRLTASKWSDDGDETIIAAWSYTYSYSSKAANKRGTIQNPKINEGILTWKAYRNVDYYVVYAETLDYDPSNDEDENHLEIWPLHTTTCYINSILSELPRRSKYRVVILAYGTAPDGNINDVIALWEGETTFAKGANPLNVSGKTATVKYKKLKKKKQTLYVSQVIDGIESGQGELTFKKKKGNKKISINKHSGKVTIKKKGLKKGKTYKVTVKVKAAGNKGYKPSDEKTVTFKIKVKK